MSDISPHGRRRGPEGRPEPHPPFAAWLGLGGMLLGVQVFAVSGALWASTFLWLLTGPLSLVLDAAPPPGAKARGASGTPQWPNPFPRFRRLNYGVLHV